MLSNQLCACGCGQFTKIAERTKQERGQNKGLPMYVINGHNARLLSSEEQARRSSFRDRNSEDRKIAQTTYKKVEGEDKHLHRDKMEKHIGRRLNSNEIVHHRDFDQHNNDIGNLEIVTRAQHIALHLHQNLKKED